MHTRCTIDHIPLTNKHGVSTQGKYNSTELRTLSLGFKNCYKKNAHNFEFKSLHFAISIMHTCSLHVDPLVFCVYQPVRIHLIQGTGLWSRLNPGCKPSSIIPRVFSNALPLGLKNIIEREIKRRLLNLYR